MEDQSGTILVGYDGSDDAEAAMRSAAEVLAPRRAVVAYVWDSLAALLLHTDPDGLTGTLREAADELDQDDAEAARTLAARGAELAEELGLQAVSVAARGKPKAWPTLLDLAAEHDARALVVGSRGLGRVSSALLGSVSSGVLDHADLPVFVVPPPQDRWAPGPIVIAYDGSEEAKSAVDVGGQLLKVREVVVHTVWTSHGAVASAAVAGATVGVVTKAAEEVDRATRKRARRTVHEGVRLAAAHGLAARAEVSRAEGSVARTLVDVVDAHRASAVIVGSRGRGAVGAALLGSVSRALVHRVPAPVLVVRPPR